MTLSAEPRSFGKLADIEDRLFKRTGNGSAAVFAKKLFEEVDTAELEPYGTDDLVVLAADAFESLRTREPGQPKIVFRDRFADNAQFLVVDIVNDDMPFLLDSVLGELRDLDLIPELVAHPVFEVIRDRAGVLSSLKPVSTASNGAPRESFIHLQIRKLGQEHGKADVEQALKRVLADVKTVVTDFDAMTSRLQGAIAQLERNPPPATIETVAEALQFLRWLGASNFTFLGIREYEYAGDEETGQLLPKPEASLGLLRDGNRSVLRRGGEEHRLTPQSRAFFLNSPPVLVAKANSKSTVHRRVHMDTVGIKLYGFGGQIIGEMRVAGLFTATAYNLSTRNIPLLRLKVDKVLRRSGHNLDGYSGRALMNVLETLPRDELFQISPEQLSRISAEILKIDLTPRPRVFVRRDEFGRFLSVFVYLPRERFSTDVRIAIAKMLEQAFEGRLESFTPFFPDGPVVRIHYVIWRKDVELREARESELEKEVEKIIRNWGDQFRERISQYYGDHALPIIRKYGDAFPEGYRETNQPSRAVEDIQRIERLSRARPADIDIYRNDLSAPGVLRATLLQLDEPITLSKRVPILENLGFHVVSERTFRLTPKMQGEPRIVYLHDSELHLANGGQADVITRHANLENGFIAVWRNLAANDRFNGLLLTAGLTWREAALLRTYAAYLRQTGAPFGQLYVAQVLNKHAGVAAGLFALFDAMFNPENHLDAQQRETERNKISARIASKLDTIPALDEDRVLRGFLLMINATLRTNFYHRADDGGALETIALKLRSSEIEWLPAPKPFAEIFVYSPRFEGIHLRGGPIARGGLRWSDRSQDFRTEILSLAKAQQVKNVVIVPRGAKGGFVPRKLQAGDRERAQAEGIACYKTFVSTLLSLTDNVVNGEVIAPADTIRRDGDDAYLVVAADKGTATFSDIANDIAVHRNFWLGDAFASGGSAGYDHKKMAITARGAWEAVKRHFREMNIDIQTTPFTVAGVGDMSGDVFGNGMLLSKSIKLVAAFDHRDIFIDPDPEQAASWEERKRLFDLPRSSWQDYDKSKLSTGGGIYSRSTKYIHLSNEAQRLLGVGATATPNDVMNSILKARVDLLWFGGIGTYVRASGETDLQVGDKANDAIRVSGKELGAKVIGEGANLGVTQRGRIEFAASGGRINTDAIDNSAGVNTSDVEVNIKIALGAAVTAGKLDLPARNQFLAAMTDEVAHAVLRNNYLQTLAISLGEQNGLGDLGFQQRLIQKLEKQGTLDRRLEALPSETDFRERRAAGKPLTRPELAVLLAYAKLDLENDLIHSTVPDDPYLGRALFGYFPPLMRERFASEIETHQLRREIIATSLTNDIINRGGSTFVVRLVEETGHPPEDIAYAFATVMAVYRLQQLYTGIDALDGVIDGQKQLALYANIQRLLRHQTAWFLRHGRPKEGLEPEIERYRDGVEYLVMNMGAPLSEEAQARLSEHEARLREEGLPAELAKRIAALEPLSQALDIVSVANASQANIGVAAKIIFAIRDAFRLDELARESEALAAGEYFDRLAVNSSLASVAAAQRALAKSVIADKADFGEWRQQHAAAVDRVAKVLGDTLDGHSLTLAKLTVGVAQLRDLAGL